MVCINIDIQYAFMYSNCNDVLERASQSPNLNLMRICGKVRKMEFIMAVRPIICPIGHLSVSMSVKVLLTR